MSDREETSGPTQDMLEGLYLSAGLGTPRDSPERAGGSGWGEGCLGFSAEAAAPVTQTRISGHFSYLKWSLDELQFLALLHGLHFTASEVAAWIQHIG